MLKLKRYWFLILLMFAVSCGWHGSGTVVAKDYDAAWVQMGTQCHATSKGSICVPNNIYWPESFQLQVKDAEGKKHWVDVSSVEYNRAAVGDSFANGSDS